MNFHDIKNFTPSESERYIFVEQGKPTVVLMSFNDYKKMISRNNPASTVAVEKREREPEMANEELAVVAETATEADAEEIQATEEKEKEALKEKLRNELTLEDLPF